MKKFTLLAVGVANSGKTTGIFALSAIPHVGLIMTDDDASTRVMTKYKFVEYSECKDIRLEEVELVNFKNEDEKLDAVNMIKTKTDIDVIEINNTKEGKIITPGQLKSLVSNYDTEMYLKSVVVSIPARAELYDTLAESCLELTIIDTKELPDLCMDIESEFGIGWSEFDNISGVLWFGSECYDNDLIKRYRSTIANLLRNKLIFILQKDYLVLDMCLSIDGSLSLNYDDIEDAMNKLSEKDKYLNRTFRKFFSTLHFLLSVNALEVKKQKDFEIVYSGSLPLEAHLSSIPVINDLGYYATGIKEDCMEIVFGNEYSIYSDIMLYSMRKLLSTFESDEQVINECHRILYGC